MFIFKEKIYITAIGANYELETNPDGTDIFSVSDTLMESEFIPYPVAERPMSRFVRTGVAAAMECLQQQPEIRPDAILTATGLGCLGDTEKCMGSMLDNKEEFADPLSFMQSSFNIIGSQIARLTGNHCYNNTYVHRGCSLASAFLDAALLISEKEAKHVLVGAVDELTPSTAAVFKRLGIWKNQEPGEGAAFFMLSAEPGENQYGELVAIDLFSGIHPEREMYNLILDTLWKNKIDGAYIVTPEEYKAVCGEYFTSISFPVWGVAKRIQEKICECPVVIYNSFLENHSLIIIKP